MSIQYLLKQQAIFVCQSCGDTTSIMVPGIGETRERSYCCNATYLISNEIGTGITITRIEDRKDEEEKIIERVVEIRNQ